MVKTKITFPIEGQNRAKKLLRRHIETNNIPSAFLFHGPSGCGKFTMASYLAEYLTNKKIYKDINNIMLLYPISTKQNLSLLEMQYEKPKPLNTITNPIIPISLIKELIMKLSLSVEGKRIVLIKNIEYARTEALNAFLKTLEVNLQVYNFLKDFDQMICGLGQL